MSNSVTTDFIDVLSYSPFTESPTVYSAVVKQTITK